MNGTGTPDRAQTLGLSTLQGRTEHRCRAQSSHAKILKKNNRRTVPVATGAPGRAPSLVHPRLAHARTRHQGPWEVTYTGASP